jgi:hypothetical protein
LQLKSDLLQGATANIFFTQFDPNNGGLDIQVPPSSSQGDSECQMPGDQLSNMYDDEIYGHELHPGGPDMDDWTPQPEADHLGNSSSCMNNFKNGGGPTFGSRGTAHKGTDDYNTLS